jgi:hypothetical protein
MTIEIQHVANSFANIQNFYTTEHRKRDKAKVDVNELGKYLIGNLIEIDGIKSIEFKITDDFHLPKGLEFVVKPIFGNLQTSDRLVQDFENFRTVGLVDFKLVIYTKSWMPIKEITIQHDIQDGELAEKINKAAEIANATFSESSSFFNYFNCLFDIST